MAPNTIQLRRGKVEPHSLTPTRGIAAILIGKPVRCSRASFHASWFAISTIALERHP